MRHRLLTLLKHNLAAPSQPILTNLAAWHDPTNNALLTSSANRVSNMGDLSGNNNNVFQTTGAKQPLLVPNSINGLQSIQYHDAGSPTGLSRSHNPSLASSAFTYFAVAKHISSLSTSEFIIAQWAGSVVKESALILTAASAASVLASTDGNTTTSIVGDTPANNAPFIICGTYSDTDHIISNSLNNAAPSTATLGANIFQSSPFYCLGCLDDGTNLSNSFNGYIGETLYYPGRQSSPEIVHNIAYLSARWSIAVS